MNQPEVIETTNAPAAIGPYSQAVKANGFLFVSGQIPLDPQSGAIVPGGIKEQTTQCLKNMQAILREAGIHLDSVVKVEVFMTDLSAFGTMNRS
jgi:2-iminobutanoate/2-iminopropanoate deaminase